MMEVWPRYYGFWERVATSLLISPTMHFIMVVKQWVNPLYGKRTPV